MPEEIKDGRIHILRHAKSEWGCFGVMFEWLDKGALPFAVTLENEQTLIPTGIFSAHRTVYYKGGYPTWEIEIPGRSRILLHKLNFDDQSLGCIGIAEAYQFINGRPAISQSDAGFNEFMKRTSNYHRLKITVE